MAAMAENRMNLAALQRRDPYITDIADTASQVALYSFSAKSNEWEKTEVEGTLFVYTRSATPINGFMILNRLGLNDLIEPINKNLEFQLQDPFLLYRNAQASIHGIWFYDKDECARIGQLMNSLVQIATDTHSKKENNSVGRQRRASESDTMLDRIDLSMIMSEKQQRDVDILQMLSKAQDEYDNTNRLAAAVKASTPTHLNGAPNLSKSQQDKIVARRSEPKPMIDNPNAAATKNSDLLKPQPLKVNFDIGHDEDFLGAEGLPPEPVTPSTQINLEALFMQATSLGSDTAKRQNQKNTKLPERPRQSEEDASRHVLKRIMSNPANTVEEIERQQRGHTMTGEAENFSFDRVNGLTTENITLKSIHGATEQDSPNTVLKRTLNIIPTTSSANVIGGGAWCFDSSNTTTDVQSAVTLSKTQPMIAHSKSVSLNTADVYTPYTVSSEVSYPSAIMSLLPVNSATATCEGQQDAPKDVSNQASTTELLTPQALCEMLGPPPAIPPVTASQVNVTHPSQAANVLLSPMVFQTSQRLPSPTLAYPQPCTIQNTCLSDTGSNKSASPQQDLGLISLPTHLPSQTPTSKSIASKISPLTREQLQQAIIHLLNTDCNFLTTLHEAYVKSLHQELIFRGDKS